jgi:prophage regulatory protein
MEAQERIISKRELRSLVSLSDTQIRRLEKKGTFPKRILLGLGRVGWLASEVQAWIEDRKAERDRAA